MSKINNHAEYPISKNIPNEETLEAMREAESGEGMERLDFNNWDAFLESLGDDTESHPESCHIPNEKTIAAIEEARAGKHAGTVDTSSMEAFLKSMDDTPD